MTPQSQKKPPKTLVTVIFKKWKKQKQWHDKTIIKIIWGFFHLDCPHSKSSRNSSWTWVFVFFSWEQKQTSMCFGFHTKQITYQQLRTWTNLVSLRSICMRISSQASHMHVSDRCRYCRRVEMWVNLRAILVTSGRQSDNKPVSSWVGKKKTETLVVFLYLCFLLCFSPS